MRMMSAPARRRGVGGNLKFELDEKALKSPPALPTQTRRHFEPIPEEPDVEAEIITDDVRCRLYRWLQQTGVTYEGDWKDIPTGSEEAFDAWVVPRVSRPFGVAYALFEVQNHQAHLRLWHIIQSRAWTVRFARLVELAYRPPTTSVWRAACEWFQQQRSVPNDVDIVPFLAPVATDDPPHDYLLRLVRDACRYSSLDAARLEVWIEQAIQHDLGGRGTRKELTSRRHATVQLARLLASTHTLRPVHKLGLKAMHVNEWATERLRVRVWLQAFLVHGCACTV